MGFRASQLESIQKMLGDEEFKRIMIINQSSSHTQLGKRVAEIDTEEFHFAIVFLSKVKSNAALFSKFLHILNMYKRDRISTIKMYTNAKDLFSSVPDLFADFQQFLPDPTLGISSTIASRNTKSTASPEESAFFQRVQSVVGSEQVYSEFLRVLNLYNQGVIKKEVLVDRVSHFISKSPDLFQWFCSFVDFKPPKKQVISAYKSSDANIWKVEGSYRLVPRSERKPCSGRDDLSNSVLNDLWVSHPTWKNESFSICPKSIHEELLHKAEDERFELDMKLLTNQVAVKMLKSALDEIKDLSEVQIKRFVFKQEDLPTTLYKKAIKLIYEEPKHEEMSANVLKMPSVAIPVILYRLEYKYEELTRFKQQNDRYWRDTFATNFWKSLDHQGNQSNNFKNNDKKIVNPKYIIQEARENHASKHRQLQNTNIPLLQEELILEFQDLEVLKILLYAMTLHKNTLSSGDYKKYDLWLKSFIFPIFNLGFVGNSDNDAVDASDIQVQFSRTFGKFNASCIVPSAVFVSMKLINLLYARLLDLKTINKRKKPNLVLNKVAIERNYKCLPHPYADMANDRFQTLINHSLQFVQAFQDQNTFDEHCLNCFGLDGYKLTTINQILQAISKSLIAIDSVPVVEFARNCDMDLATVKDELMNIMPDEVLFKLDFEDEKRKIQFQLLDDENDAVANEKWDGYVDKFLNATNTLPIDIPTHQNIKEPVIYEVELKNGKSYKFTINPKIFDVVDDKNSVLLSIGQIIDKVEGIQEFTIEMEKLHETLGGSNDIQKDEMWFNMEEML